MRNFDSLIAGLIVCRSTKLDQQCHCSRNNSSFDVLLFIGLLQVPAIIIIIFFFSNQQVMTEQKAQPGTDTNELFKEFHNCVSSM